MTWSIERTLCWAWNAAAVVTVGVFEAVTRRPGHDWDRPLVDGRMECDGPDAADTLADAEAEYEVDDGPGLRWTDADSTHPAGVVGNTPPLPPPVGADWLGWAVPAVLEVLAEHLAIVGADGYCYCYSDGEGISSHGRFADWSEWREHVAPIIADRIACDPARAIAALRGSLNRSFMESGQDMGASFAKEFFPQHQKPSK